MLENCVSILTGNTIGVLATAGEDGPHTSLMTYVAPIPPRVVYFVTARDSRKWQNMQAEPIVSMLIDTRTGHPEDRSRISALTIRGRVAEVDHPEEFRRASEQLLEVNPALGHFLDADDSVLCRVDIETFQLLSGVAEAFYYTLPERREEAATLNVPAGEGC